MREGEGGAGWTGEAVQPKTRGHPLLEQKEILRGYLRQVGTYSSDYLLRPLHLVCSFMYWVTWMLSGILYVLAVARPPLEWYQDSRGLNNNYLFNSRF